MPGPDPDILIREAAETDVEQIRDIYRATYGQDYAYPQYYDTHFLKRMVFSDNTILLVAEDTASGGVVGCASVILEIGAFADLVGEFGRLAVHPDARRRGIGRRLMEGRLQRVGDRLHLALVDARVTHRYSQKIACRHDFAAVGFLPMKFQLHRRESIVLLARHFGPALSLRRNNPRVIPEAFRLAEHALPACGLPCDAVADDESAPYPPEEDFQLEELASEGYTHLLHIERGRVRHREIFGPTRLHYGLFKIRARHANYLLAREGEDLVGAVGFTVDQDERVVHVFEMVSLSDRSIHFLLAELERRCREDWDIGYIEVDVNAHAPRMQRTLLTLGFLPVAYIPAMVFHEVERLDAVRMVRLLVPLDLDGTDFAPEVQPLVDLVTRNFQQQQIAPQVAQAAPRTPVFAGLNAEQVQRLAGAFSLRQFSPQETIVRCGKDDGFTYLLLEGEADATGGTNSQVVGHIGPGECVGEMTLVAPGPHTATVVARTDVTAASIDRDEMARLIRQRPDIGVVVYRNLAADMGRKLRRLDRHVLASQSPAGQSRTED